jgi:hypothetical protein
MEYAGFPPGLRSFPTRLLWARSPPNCDVRGRDPQCPVNVDSRHRRGANSFVGGGRIALMAALSHPWTRQPIAPRGNAYQSDAKKLARVTT